MIRQAPQAIRVRKSFSADLFSARLKKFLSFPQVPFCSQSDYRQKLHKRIFRDRCFRHLFFLTHLKFAFKLLFRFLALVIQAFGRIGLLSPSFLIITPLSAFLYQCVVRSRSSSPLPSPDAFLFCISASEFRFITFCRQFLSTPRDIQPHLLRIYRDNKPVFRIREPQSALYYAGFLFQIPCLRNAFLIPK